MRFTPAFTSSWDAPLLNQMLAQLATDREDLVDVTMVMEVENTKVENTIELDATEVENTIELDDTEVQNTMELDDTEVQNTIQLDDTDVTNETTFSEEAYQMFENTIMIEDITEDFTNTEDTVTSSEDSMSESDQSNKYFAGCPVHNHHTDSQSMCLDDDPCSCLAEVF
jgi:exopolysaccharide biosynthesis protein